MWAITINVIFVSVSTTSSAENTGTLYAERKQRIKKINKKIVLSFRIAEVDFLSTSCLERPREQ